MEARAIGSCSGGFEGGRRQSWRRNKAGAQIGGLWQRQLDGETGGGTAWKLEPLEAGAEVLKGAGGSLGGGTKQEHRSEAFGRDAGTAGQRTGRRNGRGDCMEARATGSWSGGFEGGGKKAGAQIGGLWQRQLDGETGGGKLEPQEAAAEVLKGAGGSLGGATAQQSRSTDRRPLAEAAGRRNGRGNCMEARATGSCSGGFEGGRRQSRRRNKAGAQIGGLWQRQLDGERGDCMEARVTGSWSGGFEGGRRQSRRRNKIGGLRNGRGDKATGSCSGGFEGARRQSRRRNKAGAQIGALRPPLQVQSICSINN